MAVLGIDIGTTGCKVVLLDDCAQVVAEGDHPHDLTSPRAGWAEENPHDWWRGTCAAVGQTLVARGHRSLQAIGVSGMVPALVLLDENDNPLRPSIQQNDARAVEEIRLLKEQFPESELFRRTGATWNQQVIPPKLLWIRRHEPKVWNGLRRLCGSYEYVTHRLTGAAHTEANWALESGMWDAVDGEWSTPIMDHVGLAREALAPVRRAHEIVGDVTHAAARETGLPAGIPAVAGSADHIAAALAAGLTSEGEAVLKLGGAGDFLYAVDGFYPLPELFIDYHNVPGLFIINGCMATSGSLAKWFRDQFRPGTSYADLDRSAELIPPGSEGLILLPYFLGEKTPLHDPEARGTVLGLTLSHSAVHLYRAILEGVAYGFRHHMEVLEAAGHRASRLYVMDGGARSALWRGIIASVLGREVHHLKGGHAGSAFGVAFVAGVAAGLWRWDHIRDHVTIAGTTEPDDDAVRMYLETYEVYRETYRRLKDLYPRLGKGHAVRA